ncbi:mitochondrial carrier [Xylariomycetidae sp. FL0641]|nr:mitochondrial carrier [Xylariomycetidae sp. FL0641]
MSADFWAGYISGAVGIIIGNPLDLIKVRLQASSSSSSSSSASSPSPRSAQPYFPRYSSLVAGAAAPILGYGALNALLFVSYNRSAAFLDRHLGSNNPDPEASSSSSSLTTAWLAGAVGGLATWAVSAPTELVKCRAQVGAASSSPSAATTTTSSSSSLNIARAVLRMEGVRGLYRGGTVTAVRDSVGYGFYFWAYELCTRLLASGSGSGSGPAHQEAAKVLLCGGVAGVVTWASVFPLDVIKTRVQTRDLLVPSPSASSPASSISGTPAATASTPLLARRKPGALEVAREAYREGGLQVFFRGLGVCSVRAFVVNAVQWAVYEWAMHELGQGRRG